MPRTRAGSAALLAVLDGEVVGCGSFELLGAGSTSAEVAMAVAMTSITAASARCCWSTWSRWPADGGGRLYCADTERERAHAARVRRLPGCGYTVPWRMVSMT